MAYEIILGRSEADKKKYGKEGTIFLGKQYVKMGQTSSLSNEIYLDVARSHAIFICGKRGTGKSYTLGVIAEGISQLPTEISQNIAVLILDTMGIFWTMKYTNKHDEKLLQEWGIKSVPIPVIIYTPIGYYAQYKEMGIPTDSSFSIKPSDLTAEDWCQTFGISLNEPLGIIIERVIEQELKEREDYEIEDILEVIRKDEKISEDVRYSAENRFIGAKNWGLFSEQGTSVENLIKAGQITVIDVSCYSVAPGTESLRSLVIGLLSKKLFVNRMSARKMEEFELIKEETSLLFEKEDTEKNIEPIVWIIIDEAHEFLPNDSITGATSSLLTILREGRQPGISLVLASQQPGKIHQDVMTQSDVV
ncbi:MAG: DUF87 domain-containing protein, partial [Nanoarchaeota archaeon]